jgi:hypothetical protein
MVARPIHICSPSELDIADHDFSAKSVMWTGQMQSEMDQLVALTKQTIAESRRLVTEIDRLLARR